MRSRKRLREIDPAVGCLLEVITFGREREDLTRLMNDECDFIVALGDDASLARLDGAARLFGFGSRTSGAMISLAGPANFPKLGVCDCARCHRSSSSRAVSRRITFSSRMPTAPRLAILRRRWLTALALLAETLPPARLSFNTRCRDSPRSASARDGAASAGKRSRFSKAPAWHGRWSSIRRHVSPFRRAIEP